MTCPPDASSRHRQYLERTLMTHMLPWAVPLAHMRAVQAWPPREWWAWSQPTVHTESTAPPEANVSPARLITKFPCGACS